MKLQNLQIPAILCVVTLLQVGSSSRALAQNGNTLDNSSSAESQWYYDNDDTVPEKSIPQQKAELRAQQRMDRLSSLRWYGFQPGRPTASGMPFTTMYSPAWSRPGGRPFSWYSGYPTAVYNVGYRYW